VSKCKSARERILEINPNVNVRIYEEEYTSATAMRILSEGFSSDNMWDVIVDGSDNFPTKYLINDSCDIEGLPWVYSAILAFEGQISVFNYNGGPTYRDMIPVPPPPGDVPSCAEGGVLGILPGTMGCLQATEVIKIILNKSEGILSGRVLVYDALAMKFSEAGLKKLEGRDKIEDLIDYQGFCAGPNVAPQTAELKSDDNPTKRTMDEANEIIDSPGDFKNINPKDALDKMVSQNWSPWVLDVRLQTEHDIVSLPFTDIVSPHRTVRANQVPVSGDILVYCKAGVRGKKACSRLIDLGVEPDRLFNLDGGIMRWRKDLDPSMPKY
jgi:adenylyltransferase/sulfurtransferase